MAKILKKFRGGAYRGGMVLAAVLLFAGAGKVFVADATTVGYAEPSGGAFAAHKALYDFGMVSVTSGAGISDIRGQMFYEQDDVCDAWTTDHRFTVAYYYPERQPIINTSHYVAWEAKDQSQFQFSSERQENGVTAEQLRGFITRNDDGSATAEYVRPEDLSFSLPAGYLLPTAHLREVVRRAKAGEKFFNAVMFDGTDAEGPIEVNVFIGDKATPAQVQEALPVQPAADRKFDRALLAPEAWHVRMAVFPLADRENMTPAYEMDIILHDNSVVSHVVVDYKTFKVEQRLVALEPLPARKCL